MKTGRTWTSCTDGETLFDIPTKAVKYYVRTKATDTDKESQVKEITMYPVPAAPSVSYGTSSETFTGLTTAMEISINDAPYIPVTDDIIEAGTTPYIDQLTTGTTTFKIRKQATDTSAASRVKEFTVYPRSVMTRMPSWNPITYKLEITGAGYQYREEGGTWRSTSSSTTSVSFWSYAKEDRDSFIEVRVAPTAVKSASLPERYILRKLEPQIQNLSIDYGEEAIRGFDQSRTYQYKKSSSTSWEAATIVNGKFSVKGLESTTGSVSLDLRYATTSSTPIGATTRIVLSQKRTAPTAPMFVYNLSTDSTKAHLVNLTPEMEYMMSGQDTWIAGSLNNNENSILLPPLKKRTTYYIRYKSTEDKFPSAQQSIIVMGMLAAPTVITYNADTEVFDKLTAIYEYKVNDGEYIKVGVAKTLNVSELIDDIELGGKTTVAIRTGQRETYPISEDFVRILYPRQASPTTLAFDNTTKIMTGVNNTMQYRETGTEKWIAFVSTSYNFTKLINSRPDVSVEIRYKAVNGKSSASKPTIVNLS